MSETQDTFIYNYYDYMSSIYIYFHVKTYLIDPNRQTVEKIFDQILLYLSYIFVSAIGFKIFVIVVYFFIFQALAALFKFIINLFRLKFKINYCSSFKNAVSFLKKVGKRIFTFNFNLYDNRIVGSIMIISYFLFLFSSTYFYSENDKHINDTEKSEKYMRIFYFHFESILLIQLLCFSFYSCHNMNIATACAIFLWVLLNIILYMGYLIKDRIENVEGIFEYNEPQLIMNMIFNLIFFLLDIKCLYNVVFSKKYRKKINIILFFFYQYSGKL